MSWGALIGVGASLLGNHLAGEAQQKELAPSATDIQAYDEAKSQHDYHTQAYRPLEKEYIAEARGLDDASHVNRLARATNATNMNALSGGLGQLNAAGVDPSSGRYQAGANQLVGNSLATNAMDMAGAGLVARENKVNGLLNAAKLGNNMNGAALQGMNTSANLSTSSALNESNNMANMWDSANATARGFINYDTSKNMYDARKNSTTTNYDSIFG